MKKYWLLVLSASLFEICWATLLKTPTIWWVWPPIVACVAFTFFALLKASKHLPVGSVYAVFAGFSALGTVISGVFLYNEVLSPLKLILLTGLIVGVIGLQIVTGAHQNSDGDDSLELMGKSGA